MDTDTKIKNIIEKNEWIADKDFELKPFKDLNDFYLKITKIYENCTKEKIFKIFNAHPDLVIEKKLTNDSKKEQTGASLNECSEKEFLELVGNT